MKYLIFALISYVSFVAPANSQMLLDAAAGAAIQSSLQSGSSGNALQLLNDAKALTNPRSQTALLPGQMLNNSLAAPVSQANVAAAAAAINPDEVLFSVNGKGIALCSSGLPCLWQMRRAMGLN
jgi:hypothetical protein